jgi:hypothetical protein
MVFQSLVLLLPSFYACTDEGTQPPASVPTVKLSVEDVSCTEAWLKVSLTDASEPRTVAIQQDGQRVLTTRISGSDSLLVVEGLLPRRTYTFVAQRLRDSTVIDASPPAPATTVDTTSHNFTWQIDTLGVTASALSDVAIINDTLAYAVGAIYLRDSSGNWDPNAYNLAKWNGLRWELLRIQFYTFCGQPSTGSYPAKAIHAFGPQDVWIAMEGSQVVRWNGQSQSAPVCTPVSINKLWGESANSVYAVGNGGGIAHYTSGTWQRVESGTTVSLNDVWGGSNQWVGQNVVVVAASNKFDPGEKRLVRINAGGLVDTIPWSMQNMGIHSVWFDSRRHVYTSGGGVFRYKGAGVWSEQPIPLIYTDRIRGVSANDVWVVGDFGIAAHFNGFSWREFQEVRFDGIYESVAVKGNLMIAVGWGGGGGIILRGVRQ